MRECQGRNQRHEANEADACLPFSTNPQHFSILHRSEKSSGKINLQIDFDSSSLQEFKDKSR
jgi:hypothetical protein